MKTILDNIILEKKKEVKQAKQILSLANLITLLKQQKDSVRDFKAAISRTGTISIIGELKKKSPVKGVMRKSLP